MRPFDRRRILSLSTLALASAALAGCASSGTRAAEQPRKRRLRKALGIGMIGAGETLRDKFVLARDCGFAGIEMDGPSGHRHEDVLAARDATGLSIPSVVDSVHWSHSLGDPEPAERKLGREGLDPEQALRSSRTLRFARTHRIRGLSRAFEMLTWRNHVPLSKARESPRLRRFRTIWRSEALVLGLEAALRDAHAYGASSVLLVPAVVDKHRPYDLAWQHSIAEVGGGDEARLRDVSARMDRCFAG